MPRVSIIVPSYNHGRYLGACLDSVLAQTFSDWELHLVDDGSTDDSVEIAFEYSQKDPRITVHLNENNLGTYGTQARALEFCAGSFVAVLNSDDFWHPLKLEKQVDLMDAEKGIPFCYVLGWKADETGRLYEGDDVHADWPQTTLQEVFPRLINENRILASGVLFRRSLMKFNPSLRYSGDWVSLFRLAFRSQVGCVAERLTYWRMHESNSYVASPRQVAEEIRVREAIIKQKPQFMSNRFDSHDVRLRTEECVMGLMSLYVLVGDMPAARSLAVKTLFATSNKALLKRSLSVFLPKDRVRRHLWSATIANLDSDFSTLLPSQNLPPLDLELG